MNCIGTFEVVSNKIYVSDPCYGEDEGLTFHAEDGTWFAYERKCRDDNKCIGQLIIYHQSVVDDPFVKMDIVSNFDNIPWKKLDSINVDSGTAGFYDYEYFKDDNDVEDKSVYKELHVPLPGDYWDSMWTAALSKQNTAVIPHGVVSSSGYGDGTYNVYCSQEIYGIKSTNAIALMLHFDEIDNKEEPEEPEESQERYFKIIQQGSSGNKFYGKTPTEAAKQAFAQIANLNPNSIKMVYNDNDNNNDWNRKERYFKAYNAVSGEWFGRFTGNNPKQAANKVFTKLMKQNANQEMKFCIKECTRGCKTRGKLYMYCGKRIKLDIPTRVEIGNGDYRKQITYNHRNEVRKYKNTPNQQNMPGEFPQYVY